MFIHTTTYFFYFFYTPVFLFHADWRNLGQYWCVRLKHNCACIYWYNWEDIAIIVCVGGVLEWHQLVHRFSRRTCPGACFCASLINVNIYYVLHKYSPLQTCNLGTEIKFNLYYVINLHKISHIPVSHWVFAKLFTNNKAKVCNSISIYINYIFI